MSMVASPRPVRERRQHREQPERHLKVVGPVPHRALARLVTTAALISLFAVLFFTVSFHVRLVTGQQKIDRLDRRAEAAQTSYDRLRVEVDRLSAPDRVVARARSLGMVSATDPVWLAPGSSAITDARPPSDPTLHEYLDVKPYLRGTK